SIHRCQRERPEGTGLGAPVRFRLTATWQNVCRGAISDRITSRVFRLLFSTTPDPLRGDYDGTHFGDMHRNNRFDDGLRIITPRCHQCALSTSWRAFNPHCRATGLHARTLEIFYEIGIVEDIPSQGLKVLGMSQYANGERFMHSSGGELDSPYPF